MSESSENLTVGITQDEDGILFSYTIIHGLCTYSLIAIGEQGEEQAQAVRGQPSLHVFRYLQILLPAEDLPAGQHRLLCVEGGVPDQTLVHYHAKTPPEGKGKEGGGKESTLVEIIMRRVLRLVRPLLSSSSLSLSSLSPLLMSLSFLYLLSSPPHVSLFPLSRHVSLRVSGAYIYHYTSRMSCRSPAASAPQERCSRVCPQWNIRGCDPCGWVCAVTVEIM
jgi:hypothetical protein